ncbi:DUF5702 domain-containing protein [Gracilibacillus massiliensis]|uniref:DUF5702 domain-containing protein n=1 Tax=Gracilibacillus massiliensis TaxID=1564956 RepID=UPI00071CFEA3|nr:DUF5702 domain-containing protein [Gracilibacillus massiliensis]
MRRFLYKLKHDTKGAVSIFFVLIIAAVFFFNAVLIDYARILAAEQQSEYAVQSAVRSALAGYDNDLREYGLFGIDEAAYQGEFEEIVKTNLEPTSNADAFTFIDPKVESASIEFSRPLADPDILKHQILEEMKYKAPIEVVKELIEKFSFITTAMKETSAFIDTAEKIQDDFEEREEHLDEVETKFKELDEELDSELAKFEKNLTHPENSTYPNVNYFVDVVEHYAEYAGTDGRIEDLETDMENIKQNKKNFKKELKEKEDELEKLEKDLEKLQDGEELDPHKTVEELEEEIEELEEEIENIELNLRLGDEAIPDIEGMIEKEENNRDTFKEQAEEKASEMHTLATNIFDDLEDISDRIEEAKELNEDIQDTINEGNSDAYDNYGEAEDYAEGPPDDVNSGEVDDVVSEIEKNSAKLEDYPYDPEFFDQIKGPIDEAISRMENVSGLFEAIESNINLSSTSALEQIQEDALASLNPSIEDINTSSSIMEEDRKEFKETNEEKTDQQEEEAEESNEEIREKLDDIESIADDQGVYDELEVFVNQYNEYAQSSEGDIPAIDLEGDAGDSAGSAMDIVDSIFSGIGSILASARNRLYVNEYILLHFESAVPTGIQNKDDYMFENREVEYILYGQHVSGLNYSMALGQLFAIRFAIRFIDAFTQKEVRMAGHPIAVFVAALAHALKNSIDDVNKYSAGRTAPLINEDVTDPYKLEITYKDYVRLFLFINPSGDTRLRRIMAVIEKNTGVNLVDRQTYVTGNVETSANLIFVPQIADSLNVVGALDGKTEEGRFVFNREAHFSY